MQEEEEEEGGGEGQAARQSQQKEEEEQNGSSNREAGADFYNLWRDIDADRVAVWQAGTWQAHATWLATCRCRSRFGNFS